MFGLGFPALLIAGYIGYWFYLESQLRSFVLGWIEDQRAAGYQVAHGTITTGGFPLSVEADVPAPSITGITGDTMMTWQGEMLRISFAPWDFLTYRFDSPGEHLVAMVGTDSFAKWSVLADTATGSWALGSGGAGELVLDLGGVQVVDALDQRFALDRLNATIRLASRDAPVEEPRVTATADVAGLGLPEALSAPFPPLIERLSVEGRLDAPIVPSSLPLLWLVLRDYGGRLAIDRAEVGWGELAVETSGELRVDQGNYLAGRFPTRIAGFEDTLGRLQQAGMIDGLAAAGAATLASALAETGRDGRRIVAVDIVLEDGRLKVQDFTLLRLQPVPVAGAQG